MIQTNVNPYVYMSKYAINHFKKHSKKHNHLNALTYVSSSAAFAAPPYMGAYMATKAHNYVIANMVRL